MTHLPQPALRRLLSITLLASAVVAGGCSIMGGNDRDSARIYAPDPRVVADPAWPAVDWQLTISPVTAPRSIDTFRIAVRPVPGELQVYKNASWARTPTDMLQDTLLRALEDSGRIAAVARQGSGINADYKLVVDLRRFEADYAGRAVPSATIELNAKLIHASDQNVVASRTFLQAEPSTATDAAAVSDAFARALGTLGGEMAGWILVTGDNHERSAAHARR